MKCPMSHVLNRPTTVNLVLAIFLAIGISACSKSRPATPALSRFDPPKPAPGVFTWTLTGSGFTQSSKVTFTGRGCEAGCTLNDSAILTRTETQLSGKADLTGCAGSYQVRVTNGDTGSNVVTFELLARAKD